MLTPGDSGRAAPMTSAPFVFRVDGRPDWRAMWTSFCDLALHGGPPHRGPGQALRGPETDGVAAGSAPEMVAEIRRGIWETTGLYAELATPGWIAVTCESGAMAEWLGAAIVLENVEARTEDDRVLLPAGPGFRLADEVKSIITVLAKTHHYGALHRGIARGAGPATRARGFRCTACGLDVRVSRPEPEGDADATCPLDGARLKLIPPRPQESAWGPREPGELERPGGARRSAAERRDARGIPRPVKVGVWGSTDAKTVLFDALRRRYGRRRAIATTPAGLSGVSDPAIDLVLVDVGGDSGAAALGPSVVDAILGVLDVPALVHALDRGERGLDICHFLVVSAGGDQRAAPAVEEATGRRRGRRPTVFLDLATVEGVDVVMSWLQQELLVEPWRERRGRVES